MSVMEQTSFFACILGTFAMGLSCGTGCSPMISCLLGSYVIQANGHKKKSYRAYIYFFIGKAVAVILICMISAFIGTAIVDTQGYFGCFNIEIVMPLFVIITGLYMMWKNVKSSCTHCKGCKDNSLGETYGPMIGGFLYGLTPCPPLILLAGYAVTMSLVQSVVLGVIFSIACSLSPLLIFLVLMKFVAEKMLVEVPKFFRVVQRFIGILLMVFGTWLIVNKYL